MKRKSRFLIVFAGITLVLACNKAEIISEDCERLQHGITTSDKDEVKAIITKFINSLSSQEYSQQNLNSLVARINQQCDVSASTICFDCIDTNPSQSEIRITCQGSGAPVERTVDLSYTTAHDMVFRNLHY